MDEEKHVSSSQLQGLPCDKVSFAVPWCKSLNCCAVVQDPIPFCAVDRLSARKMLLVEPCTGTRPKAPEKAAKIVKVKVVQKGSAQVRAGESQARESQGKEMTKQPGVARATLKRALLSRWA